MITGLLIAVPCFGWLAMSVVFGRIAYREARQEFLDNWKVFSHEDSTQQRAREKGLSAAYTMIYAWPIVLFVGIFDWLFTTEHLLGVPDSETDPWLQNCKDLPPYADPVDDLQEALDHEEWRQMTDSMGTVRTGRETISPEVDPCPCGYRTECHIHCRNGRCHTSMKAAVDPVERGAVKAVFHQQGGVIVTAHPERIVPVTVTPREAERIMGWTHPRARYDTP